MPARHRIVCPEHERHSGAAHAPAEHGLRPWRMTHHTIEFSAGHQSVKEAPCRAYGQRAAETCWLKRVHTRVGGGEILRQPSTRKAQSELVLDVGHHLPSARKRHEDRLDPSVQVAAVEMKDPHQ
jgi:hypothetical protein